MTPKVKENASVRVLVGQCPGRAGRQGRLADTGHAADHADGVDPVRRRRQMPADLLEFDPPTGEVPVVPRQAGRGQYPGGRRVARGARGDRTEHEDMRRSTVVGRWRGRPLVALRPDSLQRLAVRAIEQVRRVEAERLPEMAARGAEDTARLLSTAQGVERPDE